MEKIYNNTYQIAHLDVEVSFRECVISIDFTPFEYTEDLKFLYRCSSRLIAMIKVSYRGLFGKNLLISNSSFVAEIWGHLVAYRISIWVKKHVKFNPIQKLAKFAAFRSGVIDCGETAVDSNRWFWDLLGKLFFNKYG
jgi:hypothetical protein